MKSVENDCTLLTVSWFHIETIESTSCLYKIVHVV